MTENLGFYLSDVSRLMRKSFDTAARDIGVTGAQWRVLFTLRRSPGLNQGQLAEQLDVEPITTCRMVDRLEQAGLVERRSNPNDRRAWCIYLTEAADPILGDLQRIADDLLDQATDCFAEEELDALISLLARLRENLLNYSPPSPLKEAQNG